MERQVKNKVINALKTFRGVYIYGARQVGKTTFVKQLAKDLRLKYVSLDDDDALDLARSLPDQFFNTYQLPLVIDEVQKAPELIPRLKILLDNSSDRGQILLTGSADFRKNKQVKESLVGRVVGMELYGYSCSEITGRQSSLIADLFEANFPQAYYPFDLHALLQRIIRGSFPEVLEFDIKGEDLRLWFADYVENRIIRDMQSIEAIRFKQKVVDFLHKLAWQTGGLINIQKLLTGGQFSRPTAEKYLGALEQLFLVEYLRPFWRNVAKRFVRMPKLYLTDTGVLSYLLQANENILLKDLSLLGKIFENWIYIELRKEISYSHEGFELFFFRDKKKNEVDFVISNSEGEFISIEVKAKSKIRIEDLNGLKVFASNFQPRHLYVIYLGKFYKEIQLNGHTIKLIPVGWLCPLT